MTIDPDVLRMIAVFVGVNTVITVLMVVMSYVGSALLLNGLESLDRWLDPSRKRSPNRAGLNPSAGP